MQEFLEKYKQANSLIKIICKNNKTYFGNIDVIAEKFVSIISDKHNRSAIIEIENISQIVELDKNRKEGDEGNGKIF